MQVQLVYEATRRDCPLSLQAAECSHYHALVTWCMIVFSPSPSTLLLFSYVHAMEGQAVAAQ